MEGVFMSKRQQYEFQVITDFLIGSIDESGYLRREIDDIIDDLAFTQNIIATKDEVLSILEKIQELYKGRGVELTKVNNKWMFKTASDLSFIMQKEAKVQNYIIDFMESCSTKKEYNNFFNGLTDLQETCLNSYNANFEDCTMEQKIEVLQNLDSNSDTSSLLAKIDAKIRGRSFFNILKSLTIEGYCTSELGATKLLAYVPVPVNYNAIITIEPNQKAWATR